MNQTKNRIINYLPAVPQDLPVLTKRKLTKLHAGFYTDDSHEFEQAVLNLNADFSFSDIDKPAITIGLQSIESELVSLMFFACNKDGSLKPTQKKLSKDKNLSFLWLNKEIGLAENCIFLTTSFFEAETVAQIGNKSVIYNSILSDLVKVSKQITEAHPAITNFYLLGVKHDGYLSKAYTTAGVPYLIPNENNFNCTYNIHGEQALIANLAEEAHQPSIAEELKEEEPAHKTRSKKSKSKKHKAISISSKRLEGDHVIEIDDMTTSYISKTHNYIAIHFQDPEEEKTYKLSSYIVPIARIKHDDSSYSYVMSKGDDTFIIPNEALAQVSKLRATLAANNVIMYILNGKEPSWLQTVLQLMCKNVHTEMNVTLSNGWHTFKTEDGKELYYYNTSAKRLSKLTTEIVYQHKHIRNRLKIIGTEETFKSKLLPLLHNNPALCCSLIRSLAAPLMKLLGVSPVIFNYFCRTKRGKSVMMAIACAFIGIHKETNLFKAFETWAGSTLMGLQLMLPDFNDSLLCIDDLSAANHAIVGKFIYSSTNGETGASATQNREQRQSIQFNPVIDITAEGKLVDELKEAGIIIKGGVRSRCADFALPSTDKMGTISNLNGQSTTKQFFKTIGLLCTTGCRGNLWNAWLDKITDTANELDGLTDLHTKFQDFVTECEETYKVMLSNTTQVQEILNNIFVAGFALVLANEWNFISTKQIGFTGKEFVGHLLDWHVGDQTLENALGLEFEVRERCHDMIKYQNRDFTTIRKIGNTGHPSNTCNNHLGYVVVPAPMTDASDINIQNHALWYFSPYEFNNYFNSTSKTKTNEIIEILKRHKAIEVENNNPNQVKRSRLPGNRSLGNNFYIINPYKMLEISEDMQVTADGEDEAYA